MKRVGDHRHSGGTQQICLNHESGHQQAMVIWIHEENHVATEQGKRFWIQDAYC